MIRTYILCVLASLTLVGCSFNAGAPTNQQPIESTRVSVNTLLVGDVCGVDAAQVCDAGLACKYDDSEVGTCQAKELDPNITCTKEKAPVCARKGREILAYLNECEANRHKAQIISEGFCEAQEVANDCGASVHSIGNCAERFEGFEFNAGTGSCDSVVLRGCEIETPFTDQATCETTCAS